MMSNRNPRFTVLLVVSLFALLSCSSDEEFDPIASSYLSAPQVGGLWVYDANGAYLGAWGVPRIHTARPEKLGNTGDTPLVVYPNPAAKPMPSTTISFGLPEPSRVWLWVVRAIGPSDAEAAVARAAGADYIRPGGGPVAVLLDGVDIETGFTTVDWSLATDGSAIGFYRVMLYARTTSGDSFSDYFDLLYWPGGNCELAPADLRPYLYCDEQ
jgi:hypothetical protein